jgi:hypothetical protein
MVDSFGGIMRLVTRRNFIGGAWKESLKVDAEYLKNLTI